LQELDQERKVEVVRESFLDTILNDITDIAILQEVIQRSQVEGGQWPKKCLVKTGILRWFAIWFKRLCF
jgi:hypothetical protein